MVNVWEWVRILEARSIQVCVIRAHSPLFIRLLDHDHVGKPSGVVDISYEIGGRLLDHFLSHCSAPLFSHLSLPLGD